MILSLNRELTKQKCMTDIAFVKEFYDAHLNKDIFQKIVLRILKYHYICNRCYYALANGALAQLVEQWTENPCVPGSIPGGTTKNPLNEWVFF